METWPIISETKSKCGWLDTEKWNQPTSNRKLGRFVKLKTWCVRVDIFAFNKCAGHCRILISDFRYTLVVKVCDFEFPKLHLALIQLWFIISFY